MITNLMIQKLASVGLGILLLASPVVASADMVADIQAQIQSLLVKLEQLRAGSAGATSNTFTASPTSGTAPLSVVFERRVAADAVILPSTSAMEQVLPR